MMNGFNLFQRWKVVPAALLAFFLAMFTPAAAQSLGGNSTVYVGGTSGQTYILTTNGMNSATLTNANTGVAQMTGPPLLGPAPHWCGDGGSALISYFKIPNSSKEIAYGVCVTGKNAGRQYIVCFERCPDGSIEYCGGEYVTPQS